MGRGWTDVKHKKTRESEGLNEIFMILETSQSSSDQFDLHTGSDTAALLSFALYLPHQADISMVKQHSKARHIQPRSASVS